MLRAQLRHRPLLIAGNHQMTDLAIAIECLLEQRDTFWTLSRTGKRNPQIFSSRAVELFEFGEQSRAWNWPNVTAPAPAKQRSQRAAGVIGSAGADQVDGWRRSVAAADSGAPQR